VKPLATIIRLFGAAKKRNGIRDELYYVYYFLRKKDGVRILNTQQ
jgi:hypothetical protein